MPITVRGWRVVRCFVTVPKVYDYHLAIGKVSLNSNWILFFRRLRRKVNYMICTSSLFNSKRPFKISEKPTLQGNSIHVNTYLKHPKDHVLYIKKTFWRGKSKLLGTLIVVMLRQWQTREVMTLTMLKIKAKKRALSQTLRNKLGLNLATVKRIWWLTCELYLKRRNWPS